MTHLLELWGKHTLISKQMTNEQMAAENARLKAHVERLTKAGDAFVLLLEDEGYDMESIREVDAWNAAKEGKHRA